jgi:hypothetical protein
MMCVLSLHVLFLFEFILFGFNPFHVGKKINMVRRKDSFWEYAKHLENGRFSCNFCKQYFAGGISRIKSHLSGVRGHDIQICLQVPEAIQLVAQQALQVIDTPTKRAKSVATSNNGLAGESISGFSSSHMPNICKEHDRSKMDKQFARLFISDITSIFLCHSITPLQGLCEWRC